MVTLPRVRLVTLARYHDADARTRRSVVRRHAKLQPNQFHYYQPLKAAFAVAFSGPTDWTAGLARAADVLWSIQPVGPSHATALAHARDLLDRTAGMSHLAERFSGYQLRMLQHPAPLIVGETRITLGSILVADRRGPRVHRRGLLKLNWAVRKPSQLAGPGAQMAATALAEWAERALATGGARLERGCVVVADPGAGVLARPRGVPAHVLDRLAHLVVEFGAASSRFAPMFETLLDDENTSAAA